jgi:gamma-glutamyltranspeptidase
VALNVAEALDLHRRPRRDHSGRVLYEEIRAEGVAGQFAAFRRDPQRVLSKAYAAEEASRIRAASGPVGGGSPMHQTEKAGVVDGAGNVAVASHSISGDSWGETGLFVDGVALNSRGMQGGRLRPAECRPGDRWHSSMCPYIVLRDGRPRFAAVVDGTSLLGCTLQNTVNVLGHGLDLAASIAAPRWGSRLGATVAGPLLPTRYVEAFDPAVLDAVERLGQPLSRGDDPRYAYGNNAGFWLAVGPDGASGAWLAVTDPRLDGLALAE